MNKNNKDGAAFTDDGLAMGKAWPCAYVAALKAYLQETWFCVARHRIHYILCHTTQDSLYLVSHDTGFIIFCVARHRIHNILVVYITLDQKVSSFKKLWEPDDFGLYLSSTWLTNLNHIYKHTLKLAILLSYVKHKLFPFLNVCATFQCQKCWANVDVTVADSRLIKKVVLCSLRRQSIVFRALE
jgi:hypothetical protein